MGMLVFMVGLNLLIAVGMVVVFLSIYKTMSPHWPDVTRGEKAFLLTVIAISLAGCVFAYSGMWIITYQVFVKTLLAV